MKKDDKYYLAVYATAIAVWDLAFTITIAGGAQLVLFMLNKELWDLKELLIAYLISYIILFIMNLEVLNDEKENK